MRNLKAVTFVHTILTVFIGTTMQGTLWPSTLSLSLSLCLLSSHFVFISLSVVSCRAYSVHVMQDPPPACLDSLA